MPAPTTLLELAQQRVADRETSEGQAQSALAQARADLRAAREEARTAAANLADARADEAEVRTRLAAMDTGADADPLVAELDDALARARAAEAEHVQARAAIARAGVEVEVQEGALARSRAALEAARAEQLRAQEDADLRAQVWTPRLDDPPLSEVAGAGGTAETVLAGSLYADRETALHGALPEGLRDAALSRRHLARVHASAVRSVAEHGQDLRDARARAGETPEGRSAPARTAYRRARMALERFLRTGHTTVTGAEAFLAEDPPELSQGEVDRLADRAADGDPAAGLEATLTAARADLVEAEAALARARLDQLEDPSVDTSSEEGDVTAAETAASDALADFDTDGHPEALEAWQAAVPDALWRYFLRFVEHTEALERLRDEVDPTALRGELESTEETLAGAMDEGDELRVRRVAFDDETLEATRTLEAEEALSGARVRAAIRGQR